MRRLLTRLGISAALATAVIAIIVSTDSDEPDMRGPAEPARLGQPRLTAASARTSPPVRGAKAPRRPPVIMLVLDEVPGDFLLGPDGKIDAVRYPNFAALARAGYWFRNAHTYYDSTSKAVPLIMDGRRPRDGVPPTFEGHPRTVFDMFGRRGYRIVASEEATDVCPPRYCPGGARKAATLSNLKSGRGERFENFLVDVEPSHRPTFYFKHVLLPHGPTSTCPPASRRARAGGTRSAGSASHAGSTTPS